MGRTLSDRGHRFLRQIWHGRVCSPTTGMNSGRPFDCSCGLAVLVEGVVEQRFELPVAQDLVGQWLVRVLRTRNSMYL